MAVNSGSVGQQLLDVPFAEMVKSLAMGIAQAQFELDHTSMRLAQLMTGRYEEESVDGAGNVTTEWKDSTIRFDGKYVSLLELGFTPSFYQFVDTIIEVKMSISMSQESSYKRSTTTVNTKGSYSWWKSSVSANVSTVSASYASKYQYSAEGSSLLRTKLVPVPPPAVLEERIRDILERERNAAANV